MIASTLISINISFCDHDYNYSRVVVQRCVESEREALLEFKRGLVDPSDRLITWSDSNRDCCLWDGVVCDDFTGHVRAILLSNPYDIDINGVSYRRSLLSGQISRSLLNLTHLNHLDLSGNDFKGVQIPAFFGAIKSLKTLNLSYAGFGGMIPHQLGNLSNLQYLDLNSGYYYYESYSYVESFHWLSHLHSLKYLDMEAVYLEKARDWLQVTSALPSLQELHLSTCSLPNVEFQGNTNFSSLTKLDLSANDDIINFSWVFYLTSLISLDLSSINLQGPIPQGLQNLTSLKQLDLSYNLVDEEFLVSLGKLCNLKSINLKNCSLSGDISQVLKSLSGCKSYRLESLVLSSNQLFGELSDEIGQFQKLTSLFLSSNLLFGPIPFAVMKLSNLETLYLNNNKFNGSFPIIFSPNLQTLLINDNLLQGEITETHFENATKLRQLDISQNFLTFKLPPLWMPPFQLTSLYLRSCNLDSEFPPWIRSQKYLKHLDMSNASLSGSIPTWFWDILASQFIIVQISHNHFHGHIPNLDLSTSPLYLMDLNSNNFNGTLPQLTSLFYLDLSNNSLSGSISHFLCVQPSRQNQLSYLLLKGNHLSGELPDCWDRWPSLVNIDLSNNDFVGRIPSTMGSLISLLYLHLRHNKLIGELPSSMSNCSFIVIVDVGYNQLVGSIPPWIGESLSSLRILILHSNKFYDNIPSELCHLVSLQILDLGNNSLSGSIPECFSNIITMTSKNSIPHLFQYYVAEISSAHSLFIENVEITTKGALNEYNTILKYVKAIDISSNKLSGELPAELTALEGLQSLNLSNNRLTGIIPQNIGKMTSLESLDLSGNKLCGEIPSSMSELTSLGVLNLSNNKLSGKIPQGTQLQTMSESSFVGNELCGAPLRNNCTSETHDKAGNPEDEKKHQLDWFYVSMGAGFIVGFWSSAGSVFLNRPWRIMFFGFVDRIWLQVLLFTAKCKAVIMMRFYK